MNCHKWVEERLVTLLAHSESILLVSRNCLSEYFVNSGMIGSDGWALGKIVVALET